MLGILHFFIRLFYSSRFGSGLEHPYPSMWVCWVTECALLNLASAELMGLWESEKKAVSEV